MKLLNIILGLAVIFIGVLPFLENSFDGLKFIPSNGVGYSIMVIAIGGVIVLVNYKSKKGLILR